ncbi:hypothetical protein PHLCEN_2v3100 [Hermanssonia centrifuga]|uniref:Uncharacterized protein n=1 Tax=Hermanssonia centrifuga TaxID=98765 RepID=A0A2R6R776_9APHY|nr:hypothetical protein PHLCEN_2v3100 [Hermanssonia centrifuga]
MSVAKKWMSESQDEGSRSDSDSYTGDCSSDGDLEGIGAMKKQRELDSLVEDSDVEMDDSISVSSSAALTDLSRKDPSSKWYPTIRKISTVLQTTKALDDFRRANRFPSLDDDDNLHLNPWESGYEIPGYPLPSPKCARY